MGSIPEKKDAENLVLLPPMILTIILTHKFRNIIHNTIIILSFDLAETCCYYMLAQHQHSVYICMLCIRIFSHGSHSICTYCYFKFTQHTQATARYFYEDFIKSAILMSKVNF
jgi:hypothetical protein